ncbi:hypothetical protein WJX77_002591 [Trebouxia sp. C0004]
MFKRSISWANDRGKWSRSGAITCSLPRFWLYRALAEIQDKPVEEGLGAVVQQELLRHNGTCHIVLTAVHAKVTEGFALTEPRTSASTEASHAREVLEQLAEVQQHATAKEDELQKAKEEAHTSDSAAASREQKYLKSMAQLAGLNEFYFRCRADLDSATAQIKGLKEDLDDAHTEAINTAARADAKVKKVEDEARGMVRAQVEQAQKLSTEERHKLLQLEVDAKLAQRDAEERAQRAETESHQHCLDIAGLKHDLQALRDQLAEMRQQAGAPTLVPPPAVCVPPSTCPHTALPAKATSHEGSPTQATQGEPIASPMVLAGQEPAPGPKAMLEDNTPNAADKAVTAFADGSLSPGLTLMNPPQAPLVHHKLIVDAPEAREPALEGSTPIAPAPALTANPSVRPAISLAPHSSSNTGSKRGFVSSGSPRPCPAVALAAFGSPVARRSPTTAAATTGFDMEAAPGVLSTAASGPSAAAASPQDPAPLAADTPAAVRGSGGLVMPNAVAPFQSPTPNDHPVSGERAIYSAVPPTAVATPPVVTDTAGLAEAPAPIGSPVATAAPTTVVVNSELAIPQTTTPEEPSDSLHSLAPAGPDHSAMPGSSAGAPTHVKASHSRPALQAISIIGNRPQPGEGFVTPGYAKGMKEGDYKTPPSGQWTSFDSAGSSDRAYLAQAARRAQPVPRVAATAAMAPGGVEASAGTSHPTDLAVNQPVTQLSMASGAPDNHVPQSTPEFLAALHDIQLDIQVCKPEGNMQIEQDCQVNSSCQGLMAMSVADGVAQQFGPAGTSRGDVALNTPAVTASADSSSGPTVALAAAAESSAACTAVAEASAAQTSAGARVLPAGTAASPAAAGSSVSLMPASTAAGHGALAALPLFGGALKRTASATDHEDTEADPTPSRLHRLKRQIAEGDAERAAGAVEKSPEEGESLSTEGHVGPHPFTMGVSQPRKRVHKKPDKKGHSSRQKSTSSIRSVHAATSRWGPAPPQDTHQSDDAQPVPTLLAMLPAQQQQQQQPSLHPSAHSAVAAASSSSHVVDATAGSAGDHSA